MNKNTRYTILDAIRGITIFSMVLYHTIWDLVYMFEVNLSWFYSETAYIWQQSILWTFLLLSGFCWSMGKRKLKRALVVLAASVIITVTTAVFVPEGFILFGVLSLIGTGMLVMIPLERLLRKIPSMIGLVISIGLFALTRKAATGILGIGNWELVRLPNIFYANNVTAYLGFPPSHCVSQDYVPLIPWLFLYGIGYFLYRIFEKRGWLKVLSCFRIKPLEWVGRHSLMIYMLHQPVVYAVLYMLERLL